MMQTFDPISLILIMDHSTFLVYFDTIYYRIIKLNYIDYWKPNIVSTIKNTMISPPITVIVVVRDS